MKMFRDESIPKAAMAYENNKVADANSGAWVHTNDIGSPKGKKTEAHTAPTKFGMGDYYGTSKRNPFGKLRSTSLGANFVSDKKLKIPPRQVV